MGALEGGLRLTEQGETIVQKYGNRETAAYNLELLTAGTVRRVALDRQANLNPDGPPGRSAAGESSAARDMALDEVARQARRAYESFVGAEGFVESFREATPIDVLETSGIGSRPSRRTGQATMADLRAIPWVFAWSQARFGITGWYGLGSGLTALEQADSAAFRALTSVALEWAPFRYIVANVSVGVLATDLVVARAYAELVTDDGRRARLMDAVESELALTRRMLEVVYGKPLEQARHRVSALFALRAEALRAVHRRQVELLARWRSAGRSDEQVRLSLLGTVNAIAAGLRTTG
jgi:phosphoenolpyruvate carboxylase